METAGEAPLWALVGIRILALYVAVGIAFALAFHLRGLRVADASTKDATWGFRILVTPGLVALWPVMAVAWKRGGVPIERNAHRDHGAAP